MTNTQITDPEVLELRYPVRLETFAIRRGSGGGGKYRGGDGSMRRIRFFEPMTVVIVSSRRAVPPHGLAGGDAVALPAASGSNGRTERLKHSPASTSAMSRPTTRSLSKRPAAAATAALKKAI